MRTAVVFGGAGFIGTALEAEVSRRAMFDRLIAADLRIPECRLQNVDYQICDIRLPITLEVEGEVEIFNFAAVHTTPGHEDWEYFWTNLNGAIEICRFAERVGASRITFTSSISVYGPAETPRDESGPCTPESAYGRSKLICEKIHSDWRRRAEGRSLVIVRPAVIFGCGERGNFTRLAKALRHHTFAFPGRSDVVKACAYVGELVRSMLFVRGLNRAETVYNMAYPNAYTSKDICAAFHRVAGYAMPRLVLPFWVLNMLGLVLETLAALGLRTSINRPRLAKLLRATNIVPRKLTELGYVFETDLDEGLSRWHKSSGGRFE